MSDEEGDHAMRHTKKKRGRPKMYDDSRFVEPDPNARQRGIPRPDRRNLPRHGHDESEQDGSSSDDSAAGGRLPRLFKRSASKEESGDEPEGVNHQGMKRAKAEKKKGKKGRDPLELPGPPIELHPDMAATQHKLVIGGVDIYFPVDPYLEQVKYMTSIIEALNTGKNALLESPTGTGKSLSLLAATLGWLKKQREDALANPNSGAPKTTIVYTSRTHSQLNQVVNEMKTLCYLASMTLVGSRDYLCIHEKVRDVTERWKRDLMCKNECQTGGCPYRQTRGANGFFYKNGRRMNADNDDNGPGPKGMKVEDFATEFAERKVICDIEDFAIVGRRNQVCPYYVSKKLMTEADIVFLPYNYLTNVNIASNYEMILKNSILIFDEAHNVEKTSEEGTTFDMELYDLNLIMEKLNHMAASKNNEMTSIIKPKKNDRRSSKMPEFSQNQIVFMMGVVAYLQRLFAKAKTTMTDERAGNASSGQSEKQEIVFDFENCFRFIFNIPEEETGSLLDILPPLQPYDKNQENIKSQFDNKLDIPLKPQNLLTFIQNLYLLIKREFLLDTSDQETGMNVSMEKVFQFMDFFAVIYDNYHQNARIMDFTDLFCNHFRMSFILRNSTEMATQPLKIRIWSLSPFYTFQRIKSLEPRCILLTSGTLSPMESYEKMLKTKFDVKINCNHVIDSKQQLFVAMPKFTKKPAEGGLEINLDYKSRRNDELVTQIGESVYKLIKSVPSGVLIFCTSYSVLANYCNIWKKAKAPGTHATVNQPGFKSLYHAINEAKVICTEEKCPDRQTVNLNKFMQNYRRGAIFFAVCEGKLSEGINFKDDMARMVIILGTPYANYTDIRVMQKWSYLDNMRSKVSAEEKADCLAGHEWYEQNAMRSLNQSVGRIIRHRQDYGAIIFFDSRLINHNLQRKISGWIRERLVVHESVDDVVKQIVTFFAQIEAKKTRLTQRIQNGETDAILFEDTSKLLSSVIKPEVLGMGAEESERIIAEHIKTNDQQLNIPQYDEPIKTALPPPVPRPITPVKTPAEEEAAKKKWEQAVQKSKTLVPPASELPQPIREFKASTSTSTEVKPRPQANISHFAAPKPPTKFSSSFTSRPPTQKEASSIDAPAIQRVKLNAELRVTGRELNEDDLLQVEGTPVANQAALDPVSQLDDILDDIPTSQPNIVKQIPAQDKASALFGQPKPRIGQTSKKRQATKPAKPRSNSRSKAGFGLQTPIEARVQGDDQAGNHNDQRASQQNPARSQFPPQSSLQLPPTGYTKNLFSFKFKQEPSAAGGSGVTAPPRHSPPPATADSDARSCATTQAVSGQSASSHTPTLTMLWGGKQQPGDKPTFHTPRNVLADNVKKHAANH